MTFGEKLRTIRIQRNITQQKIAKDLDSSQASITAYENGVREPSLAVIRRFAEYFHVSPLALLPFDIETQDDELNEIADAIYRNPKQRTLFEKTRNLTDAGLDTVISVVDSVFANRR